MDLIFKVMDCILDRPFGLKKIAICMMAYAIFGAIAWIFFGLILVPIGMPIVTWVAGGIGTCMGLAISGAVFACLSA